MNPASRAGSSDPRNFHPTSSDYHQKLHEKGYISEAQLAAVEAKDKAGLQQADNDVYDMGLFLSQHPLTQKQSKAITDDVLQKQRARDKKLVDKYTGKGFVFEKNAGKGHNCLIISILQHLTGNYNDEHETEAASYRKRLNEHLKSGMDETQKKSFSESAFLAPDNLEWLLEQMKKDPLLKPKNPAVEVWMANHEGEPVSFSIGNGTDKFIILQRADHFEAVTAPVQTKTRTGAVKSAIVPTVMPTVSTPATTTTVPAPPSTKPQASSSTTTANTTPVQSSTDNSLNRASKASAIQPEGEISFAQTDFDFVAEEEASS